MHFQEGRTSSPLSLSGPPLAPPRPESDLMDTKFPLAAPDACGPAQHYLDQHRNNLLLPLPTKTEVIKDFSKRYLDRYKNLAGIKFYSFS